MIPGYLLVDQGNFIIAWRFIIILS